MPSNYQGRPQSSGMSAAGAPPSAFNAAGGSQMNQFGGMVGGNNSNGMVRDARMPSYTPMGSGMQRGGPQGYMNDPAMMGGGGMYGRQNAWSGMQQPAQQQSPWGSPYGMGQQSPWGMQSQQPMFGSLGGFGGQGLGMMGGSVNPGTGVWTPQAGGYGSGGSMSAVQQPQLGPGMSYNQTDPNQRYVQGPDGGYWTSNAPAPGGFASFFNMFRQGGPRNNGPAIGAAQSNGGVVPGYENFTAGLGQMPPPGSPVGGQAPAASPELTPQQMAAQAVQKLSQYYAGRV